MRVQNPRPGFLDSEQAKSRIICKREAPISNLLPQHPQYSPPGQASSTHLDPDTAEGAAPAQLGPGLQAAQTRCSWRQCCKVAGGMTGAGTQAQRGRRERARVSLLGAGPTGWATSQQARPWAKLQFNATEAHCPAGLLQITERSRVAKGERARRMPGTAQPGWTENAGSLLFPAHPP